MEAAFDTLAYAERLKAAGIENAHANALTDALRVALGEGVATKADIRENRRELGADIAGLANRIDNIDENMATKLDLARVDRRIDGIDKRIDGIDKRIDGIEENMATKTDLALLDKRIDNIEENMATKTDFARLDKRIDNIEENMATKTDFARLDKRIDNIEENMSTKTDSARIETQVQRSINRAMFAMAGLIIALAAAIVTAIGLM